MAKPDITYNVTCIFKALYDVQYYSFFIIVIYKRESGKKKSHEILLSRVSLCNYRVKNVRPEVNLLLLKGFTVL